jgi:hypothetical protein
MTTTLNIAFLPSRGVVYDLAEPDSPLDNHAWFSIQFGDNLSVTDLGQGIVRVDHNAPGLGWTSG